MGCDTLQKSIIFIVVPLKVEVSSSMSLPHIGSCKVVWYPTWCHFLHPDDVLDDVMTLKSRIATSMANLHIVQCLPSSSSDFTSWTSSCGMLGYPAHWLSLVASWPWQNASIHSVTFWYGNTSLPCTFCTPCQQSLTLSPCAVSVLIQELSSNFINMS